MPSVFGRSNRTYNPNNDVQIVNEPEYFMYFVEKLTLYAMPDRAILMFFESEKNERNLTSLQNCCLKKMTSKL